MRVEHVQAIESGDYDAFVAPVYLRGFVRAYARFVRLDERALLDELDRELGREAKPEPTEPVATTPIPRKGLREEWATWLGRIRWRTVAPIAIGALLALAGYFALRPGSASVVSTPTGFSAGLYPNTFIAANDVLPLPPLPPSAE